MQAHKYHLKPVVLIAVALTTFLFIWIYVNNTLEKTRANTSTVILIFSPTGKNTVAGETASVDLLVQAQNQNKISGADVTVQGEGNLQITDIETPVPLGGSSVQFEEVQKIVQPREARIAGVAQTTGANLPGAVGIKIHYRGSASGEGKLIINTNNTQIVGDGPTIEYKISEAGEFLAKFSSAGPAPSIALPTPSSSPELPDLTIDSIKISLDSDKNGISCGSGLGLLVTVKNHGARVTGPIEVLVNNSTLGSINSNLNSQQSASIWFATHNTGQNTATVDPYDRISESNESNNTATKSAVIPTQPAQCGVTIQPTTSQPSITITGLPNCPLRNRGDANCDNTIDLIDFEIWRKQLLGELTGLNSDFDSNNRVDLADFEIWRGSYNNER